MTDGKKLAVRMSMTPNESVCIGNDTAYEIYEMGRNAREIARVDVRQVYGHKPTESYALTGIATPGVFLINHFEYGPCKSKTIGVRFNAKSANEMAHVQAIKYAQRLGEIKGYTGVEDLVEQDMEALKEAVREIRKTCMR